MDKVYLVEYCGYDSYKLYDIYINLDNAKKRLAELYKEAQEECDMLNASNDEFGDTTKYSLEWNEDNTAFDMNCSIGTSETYQINEQKVL